MADRDSIIKDLYVAKRIICNPQMHTQEMCIRIGQAIKSAIALLKEQDEGKYIPCKVKTETGKWDGEKCSVCGSTYLGSAPHKWRYCPDCGAKMEGR